MAGSKGKLRPDLATLGGLVVAALAIVGGLLLEGGSLQDQPTDNRQRRDYQAAQRG